MGRAYASGVRSWMLVLFALLVGGCRSPSCTEEVDALQVMRMHVGEPPPETMAAFAARCPVEAHSVRSTR